MDDPDAGGDGVAGRPEHDALTVEQDVARGRLLAAREDLDQGGLAGPVLPDEDVDLATVGREGHVLEGLNAAVGLADPAGDQDGVQVDPGRPRIRLVDRGHDDTVRLVGTMKMLLGLRSEKAPLKVMCLPVSEARSSLARTSTFTLRFISVATSAYWI